MRPGVESAVERSSVSASSCACSPRRPGRSAEATVDYERILDTIARRIAEVIKDSCGVAIVSDDGLSLLPVAIHSADEGITERHRAMLVASPIRLDEPSLTEGVFRTGRTALILKLDSNGSRGRAKPHTSSSSTSDRTHRVSKTHGQSISTGC